MSLVHRHVEQAPVTRAHVQHWRTPFQHAVHAHRHPCLGDRGVYRQPIGQGLVEGTTELYGRLVGYLVLHSYHRRYPSAHQGGRCTGERITLTTPSPLARVQEHQAQGRVAVQQPGQIPRSQQMAATCALLRKSNEALFCVRVEVAVSNEVEYMPRAVAPHGTLQVPPSLSLKPGQLDELVGLQIFDSFIHEALFMLNIERVQVARTGYHPQDPQWRFNSQPSYRLAQIRIANDRRIARETEILIPVRVVEELPGQHRQVGRLDVQLQAQTFAFLLRLVHTPVVAGSHLADEYCFEEFPAELLNGLLFGRK